MSTGNISFIFCLLGIGSLLPWNAFVNANEYFQSRLCSESSSTDGSSVELWFGLVFNVTGALALGILLAVDRYRERRKALENIVLGGQDISEEDQGRISRTQSDTHVADDSNSRQDDNEESHSRQMVYYSLSAYLAVFLFTTVLVLVPRVTRSLFLSLTLSGIGVCGASMAVTGTGVTAVAAKFPPSIGISSYFTGQAIGGLSVAIANIIAAFADNPTKFHDEHCSDGNTDDEDPMGDCPTYEADWASFSYFTAGCLFLLACLVGFHQLDRHIHDANSADSEDSEEESAADGVACIISDEQPSAEPIDDVDSVADRDMSLQQPLLSENDETGDIVRPSLGSVKSTTAVWSVIRLPALSLFITLFIVIIITPSWVVNIKSTGMCDGVRLQNDLFVPMLFVVFNAGDLTGRIIAGKMGIDQIKHLPKKLFIGSTARIAFLPLFLLCPAQNSAIPVTISSDAYTVSLLFLLAVTNGFVMNMCFMLLPKLLPDDEYLHEIGSTIMNFCLSLGLLFGSFFSFGFVSFGT